jgi:hypothetical protein
LQTPVCSSLLLFAWAHGANVHWQTERHLQLVTRGATPVIKISISSLSSPKPQMNPIIRNLHLQHSPSLAGHGGGLFDGIAVVELRLLCLVKCWNGWMSLLAAFA